MALWLLVVAAGIAMLASPAFCADDVRDRFETGVYESPDGGKLLYRLLRPPTRETGQRFPLVLFFHGAGERGDDNRNQLKHGVAKLAEDAMRSQYPCYVLAPQCPGGQQWVDTPWSADAHTMPPEPTPAMRMSLELVERLQKELSIDSTRIYVTGLSMGGFGAWDAVQRFPQRFAAAAPVCGGGDVNLAARISGVPIWVFHGDKDGVVKTKRSRDMIAALQTAGGKPRYTEYANTGHNAWTATYKNPEFFTWLFAQHREK